MGETLADMLGRAALDGEARQVQGSDEQGRRRAEDIEAAGLIERIQAGDRQAFTKLYTRYFDRLYSYLRLLLNDPHEAEDATQQVFLRAYEALPTFKQRRSFWVWLFVIARNHALDQLKKQNRIRLEDPLTIGRRQDRDAATTPAQQALSAMSDHDLLAFIERLPLAQRQVVALRYMLDLSNTDIATILGRTPQDVTLLHHRALKFLKVRLTATREGMRRKPRTGSTRPVKVAPVIRSRRFAL